MRAAAYLNRGEVTYRLGMYAKARVDLATAASTVAAEGGENSLMIREAAAAFLAALEAEEAEVIARGTDRHW